MKLVSASQVVTRMNAGVAAQSSGPMDSILHAATVRIEAFLHTSLALSQRTDYFYLDCYKSPVLWLSQAFVRRDMPVELRWFSLLPAAFETGELCGNNYYLLTHRQGKMELVGRPAAVPYYLAVRYTAGFRDEDETLPDALREAAISTAIYLHHDQTVAHGKKDRRDMGPALSALARTPLQPLMFTQYGGVQPYATNE